MAKGPCVYILASRSHGVLYVGVTADLQKRVWEHRTGVITGFTQRYGVHRLVWFEQHQQMDSAIQREKRLKRWRRAWKVGLVEAGNPEWRDLYPGIL